MSRQNDAGGTSADAGSSAKGFSVRLDATLLPDPANAADAGGARGSDDLAVSFLTPSLSVFTMAADHIAGKSFYVAVFPGGFDQGVDLDLHHEWGVVPADLHITYVSPPKFANGPYDVSLIVYTETPITDAMRADYYGVVPKAGELSAFTLSQDRIRDGDPGFGNGVVRANVEDNDALLVLENRHDPQNVAASLVDTVLTVP